MEIIVEFVEKTDVFPGDVFRYHVGFSSDEFRFRKHFDEKGNIRVHLAETAENNLRFSFPDFIQNWQK
ncbi:hypothetical protein SDC9_138677 [bioreactor metagenome]|uniref:Uncharacterized protein n=1 Tax=bioreactor metagenome TaxID=1076179 RepID=A0A645DQF9_9ZZZZ